MHSGDMDLEVLRVDGDVPPMARRQGLLGPGLGLALGLAILVLFVLLAAVVA